MLRDINNNDFEVLSTIIRDAIRSSVTSSEEQAGFLIDDIERSLRDWFDSRGNGYSKGFDVNSNLAGFIIIKSYWNLSHLFVSSAYQRQGIGSALLADAIESCRVSSPRKRIQLNSSHNAMAFYESSGFLQTGPEVERAGGCVPYELIF